MYSDTRRIEGIGKATSFSSSAFPSKCLEQPEPLDPLNLDEDPMELTYVVAVASSFELIHEHSMYIQKNIRLNELNFESNDSLFSYLEIKFSALINAQTNPINNRHRGETLLGNLSLPNSKADFAYYREYYDNTFMLQNEELTHYYLDCTFYIEKVPQIACVFISKKLLCVVSKSFASPRFFFRIFVSFFYKNC